MQIGLSLLLGTWPGICGQVFIEGLLSCEPVSAKPAAFDQSVGQEVADITRRIAGVLRRLLGRDPLSHEPSLTSNGVRLFYHDSACLATTDDRRQSV